MTVRPCVSDPKGLRMKPVKPLLAVFVIGAIVGLVPLTGCSKKRPPGVLEDTTVIPPPPSMQGAAPRAPSAAR
ncbi:conserved hypothetical protein [Hyphomicrobiales bacterium]|nr:conserved hypothetical protein [Hyphomicrobiales bacterium]CAH1676461.1 conserved hypothetical protein [Hyphomicrobiales bacterium]